jgi:hypothetical protein
MRRRIVTLVGAHLLASCALLILMLCVAARGHLSPVQWRHGVVMMLVAPLRLPMVLVRDSLGFTSGPTRHSDHGALIALWITYLSFLWAGTALLGHVRASEKFSKNAISCIRHSDS